MRITIVLPHTALTPSELQTLSTAIRGGHGSSLETVKEGLAALWLHFCFASGRSPQDATQKDHPAHRCVARAWAPAAASATGFPSTTIESKWAAQSANRALAMFQTSRQDRAATIGGSAVPLLLEA